MITYDHNFANTLFFNLLTKEESDFLKSLPDKDKKLEKDIEFANEKKEQVIKKLTKNNINLLSQKPREIREYINSSEFSFESVENLIQNLTRLQLQYNDIRKDLLIMLEAHNLNSDENILKKDIESLSKKISIVESYENLIESDNQKYILLIDNFLNNEDIEKNAKDSEINVDLDNLEDNLVLKISEKNHIVELPYTKMEIEKFLNQYPNDYKTPQDVINKEFTGSYSMYNKHPVLARFREAYYLCRTKEMKSIIDSFTFAKNMMFRSEINPTIIAAVKSQSQLDDYIKCLENNTLDDFQHFSIIFEINPI